jgi:hypothetical protein
MKIQKIILIGLFAILSMTIGKSQSCYERLVDATGFNVSNQLNELEIAACELRFSLPEDYREQFTVYDMGFYSMNEYMAGGFQQVFNEKIQEVAAISNYYLLFGRQLPDSKGNAKIWMALKLPPSDVADCNNREATIIATLDKVFNPIDDPNKILTYEIEIMGLIRTLKKCEDCDNEMDDDGDGFIDCHDIDCMVEAFSIRGTKLEGSRSNGCYVPNEDEISFILEYANYLKLNGCGDTKSAIDLYADIKALEDLPIINQGFTREQLLQYIYRTQKLTRNRCTSYELHNDYITNWLYLTNGIFEEIPYEEIYKMAYWCQQLRDEIIALHLLQFGKDLLVALDIAAWELDLASTLRFFKAVPQGAKNYGIVRMVGKMEAPISSFSTLQFAQKFGINTYDDLGKIFKEMGWKASEKGVEFHHLIEQRFLSVKGVAEWLGNTNPNKWKCIFVKSGAAEHAPKFTQPWRNKIGYIGDNVPLKTSNATLQDVKNAAKEIYKDFPEILNALGL